MSWAICPFFLLDDVFGDLDPSKTQVLVHMLLEQSGQVFITAANRNLFTSMFTPQKGMDALYRVADGQVTPPQRITSVLRVSSSARQLR